jgi:hypothetical protein
MVCRRYRTAGPGGPRRSRSGPRYRRRLRYHSMETLSPDTITYTGDYNDHDPEMSQCWAKSRRPRHGQGLRGGWVGDRQSHRKDGVSDLKTIWRILSSTGSFCCQNEDLATSSHAEADALDMKRGGCECQDPTCCKRPIGNLDVNHGRQARPRERVSQ